MSTADGEPDSPATPAPEESTAKAQMKEALERKQAREHPGQSHLNGPGKAGHTHGKTGGQQRFQRKSG